VVQQAQSQHWCPLFQYQQLVPLGQKPGAYPHWIPPEPWQTWPVQYWDPQYPDPFGPVQGNASARGTPMVAPAITAKAPPRPRCRNPRRVVRIAVHLTSLVVMILLLRFV
jgi:hypothetical protein